MDTFETQECATRNSGPRRILGSRVLNRVLNFTVKRRKQGFFLDRNRAGGAQSKSVGWYQQLLYHKNYIVKKTFCLKQGSEMNSF